jgi:hypothetical protein
VIETLQIAALFATGGFVLIDGVHRASAWHGPTARFAAVVLNAVYMAAGSGVGMAPFFLPREQWPALVAVLVLSAAGLRAVTGRRGQQP